MGSLGSILRLQLLIAIGSSFWILATADKRILLEPEYSLHERPPTEEGEPLLIQVCYLKKDRSMYMLNYQASINLRNILEVWEKEQLVSLETTLRLYWKVTKHPQTKSCVKKLFLNIFNIDAL